MATAPRHLTTLRADRNSEIIEYVDLAHSEIFDWRHWLARRLDLVVVGNGAWAFWFVRICSRDTSLLDYRGDFFARCFNQNAPDARLHPQQARQRKTGNREALQIYGRWESWRLGASALDRAQAALATAQGRQPAPQRDFYTTASQAEIVPLPAAR